MALKSELLAGVKHYLVPTVMLREQILHGSQGKLFYPASVIEASAGLWAGVPVVVHHPSFEGSGTAASPAVFNSQRVGIIFDPRWEAVTKSLKATAWLSEPRMEAVDWSLYFALLSGEKLEVSTGLSVAHDGTPGRWMGEEFDASLTNIAKADHLAILGDQRGACSLADGCGLAVNKTSAPPLRAPSVL